MTLPVLAFSKTAASAQRLAEVLETKLKDYTTTPFKIEVCSSKEQLKLLLPSFQTGLIFFSTPEVDDQIRSQIKSISLSYPQSRIVLVSKEAHAYAAWELEVYQFVASPAKIEDLLRPVRRYIIDSSPKTSPLIKLRYQGGLYQIGVNDILFCRADGNYSHIHLSSGKSLMVTAQLNRLNSMLQAFPVIERVGRSYLFNVSRIREIDQEKVTFNNSPATQLKLSAGYIQKVKDYLLG